MENTLLPFFVRANRRRESWNKFVRVMACVVVFCTVYALILPGITMQYDTYCETQAHTHSESCYSCQETALRLVCADTLNIHEHTEACFDAAGNLACGFADYVLHTHDSLCYDEANTLICTLPQYTAHVHSDACYDAESSGHTHDDNCYDIRLGDLKCEEEEKEGHTHAGECYAQEGILSCTETESTGHAHGEACYQTETALSCGLESHPHSDSCYSTPALQCVKSEHAHKEDCYSEGSLTCTAEEHTHDSGCYSQKELVCGLESHPHTDACYTQIQTLVCDQEESEGHAHNDGCYTCPLVCQLEEEAGHLHTDACYEQSKTLICTLEVGAEEEPALICGKEAIQVHTHEDSCRDNNGGLVCGMLEAAEHIHTQDCLAQTGELPMTCTLAEDENHQHGQLCYGTWTLSCEQEEHIHSLACYSNPDANVETEEIWMRTFADVDLTGSFADDLAAIARTQNGYAESKANYQVQEDGIHIKGYTRYGAWAGDPYADWNAHFVAFCASYARIPEEVLPTAGSVQQWVDALSDDYYDLYNSAESYAPKTGDLIFLHEAESEEETEEEKSVANFMGIVLSCTDTAVTYIAGDSHDEVAVETVTLSDTALLGYGHVFAMPMMTTLEESPNDLGASVTVSCLNGQGQSTDTYAGGESFTIKIDYGTSMEAGQTYTLTLSEQFANATVTELWGSCPSSYDAQTGTVTFSPTTSGYTNGTLSVEGTVASYSGEEALTVAPVSGNAATVTVTRDLIPYSFTQTLGNLTVTVALLEPSPAGSMDAVAGMQLTQVLPTDSMYDTMVSGEKRVIGSSRIYEHQMFRISFVDENGNVVEGLDLSSRNVTITVEGTDSLKGMGTEGTGLHTFYRDGNAVKEAAAAQENAAVYEISGSALTENAFLLDVISVNPNELGEGSYGNATFAYNDIRDAFIHDPKYAAYYNEDSPLGTSGSFHLVAFGDAYLNSHTNGNILAYNLYANNNFGSNHKDGYDSFTELHYVQNYKAVNATSSARSNDILVIGSDNTMGIVNGNEFVINDTKIGKPKNVIQDEDSNTAPFIDLHRVESEIRAISANLGSYEDITATDEFIIATDADHPYLEIQNKDNIGVWNATPAEIQALKEKGRGLSMKGFESDGSGAIIVNVDMSSWPDNQILELPVARVYVDGQPQSVSETLDFSAGKVIWNFTNADGKQIKTDIMTGMVVAPGATVTISQNLNGTVVAENIDVRAESHRTDFVGKIYKNEFLESAHIHVHKVDKGNYGKMLSGAEFDLYEYVGGETPWIEAKSYTYNEDGTISETDTVLKGTTGEDGVLLLEGMKYNTVYKLVETKAPDGYVKDNTVRYLYFERAESEQGPKPDNFDDLTFINTAEDGDCVHYHFTNIEQDVEKTSISVNKVWDFGQSGLTEAIVDLVYYNVYQVTTTIVGDEGNQTTHTSEKWYGMYPVTKDNNWQSTVSNLPLISADGTTTYSYYIKEVSVPGFDTSYLDKDGVEFGDSWSVGENGEVTIKNQVDENTEFNTLIAQKRWTGGEPDFEEITFDLFRTTTTSHVNYYGEFYRSDPTAPALVGTYSLTAANNWKWESELLPYRVSMGTNRDQWGNQYNVYTNYEYQIVERPIEGYTPEYTTDYDWQSGKYTLTINNVKDATTSITVAKVWRDKNGGVLATDKIPADGIQVQLQRMSESVGEWENYGETVTIGTDGTWTRTFDNLPAKDANGYFYKYRVVEAELDGFGTTYDFVLTEKMLNGATYNTVNYYGSGSVTGANAGDEIELQLQRFNVNTNAWEDCAEGGYTVTLGKNSSWSLTVEGLDKAYRYRVRVADGEEGYSLVTTENATKANFVQKLDFTANGTIWAWNVWSFNMRLERSAEGIDDEIVGTYTVNNNRGSWSFTAEDLPAYTADGMPYTYRLVNPDSNLWVTVADSHTTLSDTTEAYVVEGTITNTKLETTSLQIEKQWKDAAGEALESVDETSITVHIFRQLGDDAATRQKYKTVTISPDDGSWSYTQSDLPKVNSKGTAYVYTVEEEAVAGYTTKYAPEYDEEGVFKGYTITNQQRTGFTTIQVDKEWAMLDGTATPPKGASVTFDLYQRSKPVGWNGDSYVDIATAETITVQYDFGGTTHTVEGYPGETVNLILQWQKLLDTDDIQYADPGAYASVNYAKIADIAYTKSNETDTGALFTAAFTIPENVAADWSGKKIVTLATSNTSGNDRWSFVDLVLIPTARETKIGTYTMPNAQGQWSVKVSPLVASEEIGGVTIDYTYFVEETAVSGFDTTYENNGGITGGKITMINTERDIYTDLSVNKVWDIPEGETVPESITYELHKVTGTAPEDSGDVEMVNVRFEIKDNSGVWENCLADARYPKGSVLHLEIVSNYTDSSAFSWCTATINGKAYAAGEGMSMINGHPGYAIDVTVTGDMTVTAHVGTKDLMSNWTVTATSGNSILADSVVETVTLKAPWKNTHTDLPTEGQENSSTVYYSYYVKETKVGDADVGESGFIGTTFKDENGNITITNRPDNSKTSLTVKKEWEEGDGVDASTVTHGDVSVKIYRTANETQDLTVDELVDTLTFGADDNWTATKEGLPIADADGNEYTYYVDEVEVSGYDSAVTPNPTDDGTFSFTITNTAKEEGYTSVTVNKAWQYEDGKAYTPSASDQITLKLIQVASSAGGSAGDTDAAVVTLKINHGDGTNTEKTVQVAIGSDVSIELVSPNAGAKVYTNVNYNYSELTRISGSQDDNYIYHMYYKYKVSGDITLFAELYTYNGLQSDAYITANQVSTPAEPTEQVFQTITLSNETGWTHTFSGLPENDGNGTTYSYYVVEENGEEYDVQYEGAGQDAPVTDGTIKVINTVDEPRYELPHTGGSALGAYLLGWLMTAVAGIGFVDKKRRNR